MFDPQEDIDKMIAELRRPVRIDPALDRRVLLQIAQEPVRRSTRVWIGIAAVLVGLAVVSALRYRVTHPSPEAARSEFKFVAIAPQATRVALVGDFNDWDPTRTPMQPLATSGATWTAVVPLAPGRYRYGFIVDGSRWMADRAAPLAADDDFDAPSSVVTVGGL